MIGSLSYSPNDWEVPDHWRVQSLECICKGMSVGIVVRPADLYTESGIPCIRASNVFENRIDDRNLAYISKESNRKHVKSMVNHGDILVVRRGETGVACVVPESLDGANCVDLIILQPRNSIRPEFLSIFLNSEWGRFQFQMLEGGSALSFLGIRTIRRLKVPIPPLSEQDTIIEAIQSSYSSVDRSQKIVACLEDLKLGLMQRLLTKGIGHTKFKKTKMGVIPESWKVMNLGDFAAVFRQTIEPRDFPTETFELYSIPAFHKSGTPEIKRGDEIGSMKQLVNNDTILFGALNPRVPKVWFASSISELRRIASTEFICLEGNKSANSRFIYHLCQTSRLLTRSMSLTKGTTPSRMRVDRDAFLSLAISAPPIGEQREIVSILDTIDAKIEMEQEIMETFGELKKGLMQNLLTGNVRVSV